MKTCIKCNINKLLNCYHINKDVKNGYKNTCKDCINIMRKIRKKNNPEKTKCDSKKYRKKYLEKIKENFKKYYKKNKKHINEKQKSRWKENEENNKEQRRVRQKKYREKNKEKLKNKRIKYYKNKRKNDQLYRFKNAIRSLIKNSLTNKGHSKKSKTSDILGCALNEFKFYIESKFESWMTWENRGLYNGEFNYGWDIDHIIPLSSTKTEKGIIQLNHYTNLQPLCSKINREIKKDKLDFQYIINT